MEVSFRWDYADGRVGGLIRDCVGGAPKESSLVERVVGHLNNEKAAPPSLLEQSCGQGMHVAPFCHGRYDSCALSVLSVSRATVFELFSLKAW